VAEWTIPNDVAAGDATVSFFAPRPEQAELLERQVREFSAELPEGVRAAFRPRSPPVAGARVAPEPPPQPEEAQDAEASSSIP
jgi:hypothetical protein